VTPVEEEEEEIISAVVKLQPSKQENATILLSTRVATGCEKTSPSITMT
jgi:hypothetical protein